MSRRTANGPSKLNKGKPTRPSPMAAGFGGGFMPNFGVDIPLEINMKPALGRPGAPDRPGKPDKKAKKPITGSPKNPTNSLTGPQLGPQLAGPPLSLGTPPPPGQRSKAGIPPPPSHGGRNMAVLSSVKLNSIPGKESPSLLKQQPLPKISTKKSQKKVAKETSYSDLELILYGHILADLPALCGRQIRVFLSSTFSDMKAERNEIWATVYPAVRSHCLSNDLEFSFVDMRWGVLDHATDHHKTEDVVLDEVQRTIKVSATTSFLSIIGHRYGSVVNENKLACHKFDLLQEIAVKNELSNRELLDRWYKRDDNHIPPVHVLQPISTVLPDYLSEDADKKAKATAEWNTISDDLWNVNYTATKLAIQSGELEPSELEIMKKSVTTTEIEAGIVNNPKASTTTYGIYRKYDGIEADIELPSTARFIDVAVEDGKTVVNRSNLEKIQKFVAEPISKVVKPECRKMYSVPWSTGGIPTDVSQQSKSDREFLCTMSSDLSQHLIKEIGAHLDSQKEQPTEYSTPSISSGGSLLSNPAENKHVCTPECMMKCALASKHALINEYKNLELVGNICLPAAEYKEILHHLKLAELKSRVYCGRRQQLDQVKSHLINVDWGSPLMVYGSGGGGKTPFAAQIAKLVHTDSWLGSKAVVIIRFIGSTLACEHIHSMLRGLLVQISCAYQIPVRLHNSESIKHLGAKLNTLLKTASSICSKQGMPLVIVLDGVEHLTKSCNTHNLTWIPTKLPPGTFIITTFNPEEHNLLSTVKAKFDKLLELPPLTLEEMMEFVDMTLKIKSRTLTPNQRSVLQQNLGLHPSPVYAQLLSQLALETPSSMSIGSKLSANIEDTVNTLLMVLEKRYGEKLVSYALSYITCGHLGISEIELEDVLSCSDEVLDEVYVYHEPPVPGTIRLPSHLWPMLRNELEQYLVEKSANDYLLLSWYHKPLHMAVSKRYLSDPAVVKMYHKNFNSIYMSPNGVKRTITLTRLRKPITIENADRQIAHYSNSSKLPMRALFSIAHHLVSMGNVDDLKAMTVCNLEYTFAVWQKIDLKYMITLNSEMIQKCRKPDGSEDEELKIMLHFFETYLSAFNDRKYCDVAMMDFYIQILGAFSFNSQMPHINSLVEKAKAKVSSSQLPLIVPTDQCLLFGRDELRWELSDCTVTGDIEDDVAMISVVTKTEKSVETVDINESLTHNLHCKTKISSVRLSQRRLFALTDATVYIEDYKNKDTIKSLVKTDSLTKGELLNKAIAVSASAKLFCLGGKDKIAVYEDKSTSADSIQYKAISSLSLGGVKSTEAIVFTTDEKYTVSAHTIAAPKNRNVGGLIKWDYETKTTESRMSLPAPVLKGCFHLLTYEDKVVVACDHNEVLLVSMKEQRILCKLYSNKTRWQHLSLEDSFVTLVLENGEVQVIKVVISEPKATSYTPQHKPTSACTCASLSLLFIGSQQGTIDVYDMAESKLLKHTQVSSDAVTKVKAFSDQYLLVHDSDNEVLVLNIEKMVLESDAEEERDHTANSLGTTYQGVFSCDGEALLIERLGDEAASLYNISDLSKVNITASTGYDTLALCGNTSYLVGEKDDSLGLWNLGKGEPVIPPPVIEELCTNRVPYTVSPHEPLIMFADGGMVTYWNIASGEIITNPYIGAKVHQIRFSSNLVVISLRSGNADSWLVHLIDRQSGATIVSAEKDEAISDVQCNTSTAMFVSNGSCYLMNSKEATSTELKLSAPVQHISSCGDNYVAVCGGKSLTLIDGQTGCQISSVVTDAKVSGLVFSTDKYTLIALPLGNIQLINWQPTAGSTSHIISNKVQTTCSHLSASMDKSGQVLLVYGRQLDQSRLFTFELNNM